MKCSSAGWIFGFSQIFGFGKAGRFASTLANGPKYLRNIQDREGGHGICEIGPRESVFLNSFLESSDAAEKKGVHPQEGQHLCLVQERKQK